MTRFTPYARDQSHTVVADAGVIAGFSDVKLSSSGEASVSELALSMVGLPARDFHSSDLQRAVRTAELLGGSEAIQDPRLRELNFGDWEGLTWEQVHEHDA